jgi:nitrogen regulatory protein PII
MKRLDLIVSERELERLCAALTEAGAPGYTVLRHATGWGHGGTVSEGMEFSGFGANGHVIVFCEADALGPIRDAVKPLLTYYGGVGFVSEAVPL